MRKLPLPTLLAACTVLHFAATLHAGSAIVRSPETAQTYADNTVQWRQLRWLPGSQQLVATITFGNTSYVSDTEPQHNETFNFPLPGVRFDAATGTFSLRGAHGRSIPVAVLTRKLFVQGVDLLPTAQLRVTYHHGLASVELIAGGEPTEGNRWGEYHHSSPAASVSRMMDTPLGGS